MLNKRFKIAKCKTSLKLATSRIKLMRNKKGVQIVQMKKELAQLLEAGEDRTARIRVEHVIREEKMVAAYDLIEIYCELIVARLPIIESQKTCPIDLKEAVTSVIFAAPRCSDITELADAKKNFTAKYGKEFVSAAIELRPDCGVSRMLIEKLSAVAPDVQTKVKVLSAVAKEHNINWDPTSFEEKESKPPDDLLNGPTYFEKASTMSVDSPKIQTSNVQNVHIHEVNSNEHFDFAQQNKRFTVDAQNVTAAGPGGVQKSFASTTHDDMMNSGPSSGMMNTSQSFHRNNSNSSSGKEKWNMEFKDATSAAQAAAESAERASYAARAAAELSSQGKITRQYSTESYVSEQKPQGSSEYTGQHSFKNSYNNTSFNDRKPKIQNQNMDPTEIDASPKATKKFSSFGSRNDSINESSVNHFETHETSSKKESRARFTNGDNEGSSKSANVNDYYGAGVVKKNPSINPSRTHSTKYDGAHTDDETDSDDGPRYDTGFEYDEGEAKAFFPSPDREPFRPPISSPKKNTSNTTGRVDSPKSVDHSVKFDHSDGPDSETETEITKLSYSGPKKSTSRVDPTYVESPRKVNPTKSRIELNDLVETGSFYHNESDDSDAGQDLKFGTLTGGLRNKSGLSYPPYTKTALKENPVKVDPTPKQSSYTKTAVKESLEKVDSTSKQSSYTKTALKESLVKVDPTPKQSSYTKTAVKESLVKVDSTSKQSSYTKPAVKESVVNVDPASKQSSFNLRASRTDNKKPSVTISSSESDSDDHKETFLVQKSFKTKSQFAPPEKFFSNDETDSEDERSSVSKRTSTGKVQLALGLSRRTKDQVKPVGKTVVSNPVPKRESLETSSTSAEQKSNTRYNITKSPPEPRPEPTRFKQEPSRTKPDPRISEPPQTPRKKIVEPGKTEGPKTTDLSSENKVEANNAKKPSHVHPKLPEYDSLAATIHALNKMNHQ